MAKPPRNNNLSYEITDSGMSAVSQTMDCGRWSENDQLFYLDWCLHTLIKVWFDEEHELVYFHGLADTVLEPHLYVVSMRRPGTIFLSIF